MSTLGLATASLPLIELVGVLVIAACTVGGLTAILGPDPIRRRLGGLSSRGLLERERDIAAGLGWRWRDWVVVRASLLVLGITAGAVSRIWVMVVVGALMGTLGFRFALAGRAASRRLRMERAFLARLRDLRDRMAVGNQSLDTALQEIGRSPGPELGYVLAPLARGGHTTDNIVEVGMRARSPIVEYACAVLIWTRSRSLDALIVAIDELLLPVGEAQLAVQAEAAVTLTQQRAVTIAMSALLAAMFVIVVRVDAFGEYYRSFSGNIVLIAVVVLFALLVGLLSVIVRVGSWTRWDLERLAHEQERLNAQ